MSKRAAARYAAETIRELRAIAADCQSRGDKAGVAAAEYRIQRVTEGWS